MPQYAYTAVDREGHAHADVVVAPSPQEARKRLGERGFQIRTLDYEEKGPKAAATRWMDGLLGIGTGRVKAADVAAFYKHLAIQLEAGIDIRRAVSTLANQNRRTSPVLGRHLTEIHEQLDSGESLGKAMNPKRDAFGEADVRAIEAAERAGVLEQSLHRLADSRETTVRLKKRATSALTYPAIVLGIAVVITVLLFTFVVPTILEGVVGTAGRGTTMPLPTRIVSAFSSFLIWGGWLMIPLTAVAAFIGLRAMRKSPGGRKAQDSFVLTVPVIGPMLRKHAIAQAATLLATMVRCGINLIEALDVTGRAARNRIVGDGLERWRDGVAEGLPPDQALIAAGGFPPLMVEMVTIGSESGTLDTTLAKLAETYENDVEETARRLGTIVEPALILFLAGVVLLIALAVLLPILQIYTSLGA